MWIEWSHAPISELEQVETGSSITAPNTMKQQTKYTDAMRSVGAKLAQDVLANLKSWEPVNAEQFRHDMMSNSAFHQTIVSNWSADNKELMQLVTASKLAEDLYSRNGAVVTQAIVELKSKGTISEDVKLLMPPELWVDENQLEISFSTLSPELVFVTWKVDSTGKFLPKYELSQSAGPSADDSRFDRIRGM